MTDTTLSAPLWEGERAPLIKALVAAQKASEAVLKAASNPAFRSRYADLAAVVEAVVPALNRAGVAVIQSPAFDGEMMTLTTILAHESGGTLTAALSMRPTKADPQGVGSAVTYARRYALLAMTGAAPEDDDGNAASAPKGRTVNPMSANQAKQDGRGEAYNVRSHEIRDLTEVSECLAWGATHKAEFDAWPKGWRDNIREELATHMAGLRDAAAAAFRLSGDDSLAGNGGDLADDER
jgi:ERF superfamily